MVVRSLWAALGLVWVTGLLLGWDVDRLVVCWPVSWDVVVAVDMERCIPVKNDLHADRQVSQHDSASSRID
jgi:hypothetical protein